MNKSIISGTVTLPDDTVKIVVNGDCSIKELAVKSGDSTHLTVDGTGKLTVEEKIDISNGNAPSLTVAPNATLEAKKGVYVAVAGINGTVTVNGTLIAAGTHDDNTDNDVPAVSAGQVTVKGGGNLEVSGVIGVSLGGMKEADAPVTNLSGAFTLEEDGIFTANGTENAISVSDTLAGNPLDELDEDLDPETVIVIPLGYLPEGYAPEWGDDSKQSIVIEGGDFTISSDNAPPPDDGDPAPPDDGDPDSIFPVFPVPSVVTPTSPPTYPVHEDRSEHGTVTVSPKNARQGETVTVTTTPDPGYTLDELTVTDSRGNGVRLTSQGGGVYTFVMPGVAVTVKGAFVPLPDSSDTDTPCDGGTNCPSRAFADLDTGAWYHEATDYVLRNGLMNGYSSGTFGPNDYLTRAQLAQILYNKAGAPIVMDILTFTDAAPGQWYTRAVTWAAVNGIAGGYGDGHFGPNDNITREQLAVMLWRYAGSPAASGTELSFTDAYQASGYALEALRWAAENGILSGYGGQLNPSGLATRAQAAQMLKNYMEQ